MRVPLQIMMASRGKLIQWNHRMASGCFFSRVFMAGDRLHQWPSECGGLPPPSKRCQGTALKRRFAQLIAFRYRLAPDRLFEELVDPLVLVRPAGRLDEGVVLRRVRRKLPVCLAQFDQALREAHAVLKMHVRVDHAVADEQASFQTVGEVDWR